MTPVGQAVSLRRLAKPPRRQVKHRGTGFSLCNRSHN